MFEKFEFYSIEHYGGKRNSNSFYDKKIDWHK